MEILSRIAFDQEFADTGGKTLQLDRDEHVDITATARNSLAKSLLYHLRNLSADAIIDQFDGVRDRVFEVLRSQRRLPTFVDVAIDLHEWHFCGSADTDHVTITYPDLGTNKAFCSVDRPIACLPTVGGQIDAAWAAIPEVAFSYALLSSVTSCTRSARRVRSIDR